MMRRNKHKSVAQAEPNQREPVPWRKHRVRKREMRKVKDRASLGFSRDTPETVVRRSWGESTPIGENIESTWLAEPRMACTGVWAVKFYDVTAPKAVPLAPE